MDNGNTYKNNHTPGRAEVAERSADTQAPRILVIGDAMVDAYLETLPVGISDEAPVPVVDWAGERRALGGALNVAASLARLGCRVSFMGLANCEDDAGAFVRDACRVEGIEAIFFDDGRPTTQKTRIVAGFDYLARVDDEATQLPPETARQEILSVVQRVKRQVDVIVVSDYCKGMIWRELARSIVENCDDLENLTILVDTKPAHMEWFSGASLIKPNWKEATTFAASLSPDHSAKADLSADPKSVGSEIASHLKTGILMTLGSAGMMLFNNEGQLITSVTTTGHNADDDSLQFASQFAAGTMTSTMQVRTTSGAGDVVLSILAVACARNCSDWPAILQTAKQAVDQAMQRNDTCSLMEEDLALLNQLA